MIRILFCTIAVLLFLVQTANSADCKSCHYSDVEVESDSLSGSIAIDVSQKIIIFSSSDGRKSVVNYSKPTYRIIGELNRDEMLLMSINTLLQIVNDKK